MALEAHAADGSIISARVSHSHACDRTFPSVLTPRILETANPNSIVLQLLTASSRPEWRTRCFPMLWLLSRNRVSLTAPITRSLIGELIPFEDSPADEPRMKRSSVIRFEGNWVRAKRVRINLCFLFIWFVDFFLSGEIYNQSKNVVFVYFVLYESWCWICTNLSL